MHLCRLLVRAHIDVASGCSYGKGSRYVTAFSRLQSQHKVSECQTGNVTQAACAAGKLQGGGYPDAI